MIFLFLKLLPVHRLELISRGYRVLFWKNPFEVGGQI
jgi:hypothetical protein